MACNIFTIAWHRGLCKLLIQHLLCQYRLWRTGCFATVALPLWDHGQCARMQGSRRRQYPAEPPFPRTVGGAIPEFAEADSGNSTGRIGPSPALPDLSLREHAFKWK